MQKSSKILIVGHNDVIENALYQYFQKEKFENIFSSSQIAPDFLNQSSIVHFFESERPEYVFLGSTRSGGIAANQKYAAEFIYSNLESQNNMVTLGGWLIEQLGDIPKSGTKYQTKDFLFQVLAAEPNRIRRIYVRKLGNPQRGGKKWVPRSFGFSWI